MNKKALIAVLFSILLIGGGLYFFSNKKTTVPSQPDENAVVSSQNDASEQINEAAQATTTSPPTTKIDTSTWKTYRNEEYEFEVKYPQEYEIKKVIGAHPVFRDNEILIRSNESLALIGWDVTRTNRADITITPRRSSESLKEVLGVKKEKIFFLRDFFTSEDTYYIPENTQFLKETISNGVLGYALLVTEYGPRFYTIFDNGEGTFFVIEANNGIEHTYWGVVSSFIFY